MTKKLGKWKIALVILLVAMVFPIGVGLFVYGAVFASEQVAIWYGFAGLMSGIIGGLPLIYKLAMSGENA